MPKTRPLSSKFRDAIKNNLRDICEKKGTKKVISELCGCSESLITKWCDFSKDTLPNFEDLHKISSHCGVSIDWLLSSHKDTDLLDHIHTYSDAFTALVSLVQKQILPVTSIEDIILNYLLNRYDQFLYSDISEKEIAGWMYNIIGKYDIPLTRYSTDKELCDCIIQTCSGIKSIHDDDTYRNLAIALNNDEMMADFLKSEQNQMYDEQEMKFVDNTKQIILPDGKIKAIDII